MRTGRHDRRQPASSRVRSAAVRWRPTLAVVAAGLLVLLAGIVAANAPGVEEIQRIVRSAGIWAPVAFVTLQVVLTLAPVPRTVFSVAAGVLFGASVGLVVAVVAVAASGSAAYWLVRLVGGRFVDRYADRAAVAWVRARVERRGLLAVLSLRLIPVLPFAVVNYAAGLSGVRFVPYLVGTVLGSFPGTTAVVVFGGAATGDAPPGLLAVSVVCAAAGVAGAIAAARNPGPGTYPAEQEHRTRQCERI